MRRVCVHRRGAAAPPMLRWRIFGTAGFTLLEVMVAIAILAIALTTLLGNQSQSMFAAEDAQFSVIASTLANKKLAELLAERQADMGASGEFEGYDSYRWETEVSAPDFSEPEALLEAGSQVRRVDLTVRTADERRSFTLTRYLLIGMER